MSLTDGQFLEKPRYGLRQMARHLSRSNWCVERHRIRRLISKMSLAPIYQRPKTSELHPQSNMALSAPRGRDLYPDAQRASVLGRDHGPVDHKGFDRRLEFNTMASEWRRHCEHPDSPAADGYRYKSNRDHDDKV